jgi:hypothetical protein
MTAARSPWWRAVDATIALLMFIGVAEAAVRLIQPTPRGQVVRLADGRFGMEVHDHLDTPVWAPIDPAWRALREPPCLSADPATTTTVALAGDSILYVTGGTDATENVAWQLQQRLDAAQPGRWCVANTAVFAYSAGQKRAALHELQQRAQVDRVIWEVWGEAPTYRRLGGDVYAIGSYARDDQGYPYLWWLPIPAALNRALFSHSRAWEYLVIALGPGAVEDDVTPLHAAAIDDAAAEGARISFFFFPDLAGPLTEPPHIPHATHKSVRALLAARGAEVVEFRDQMVDQDYLRIRLTTCCHYNPVGHGVVADKLAAWLLAQAPHEASAPPP